MTREDIARIERTLEGIGEGQLRAAHSKTDPRGASVHALRAKVSGRGRIEIYAPFPGIEASLCAFAGQEAAFSHAPAPRVLELFYCRTGRIGWNMRGGEAVYLGPGEATVHAAVCCADSTMVFPLGYAEGFMLTADLAMLEKQRPVALALAGFDAARLYERLCTGAPLVLPASPSMDALFAPVLSAAPARRPGLMLLKAQEALLMLFDMRAPEPQAVPVHSGQTELIRRIHADLTAHLDVRYTIEELSRRYLINTSALKAAFKAVYGQPIAAYMKEYRIRESMRLLRETDESIARIAARVGYGTQGKFTQAFRDVTGELPTAYRRNVRSE